MFNLLKTKKQKDLNKQYEILVESIKQIKDTQGFKEIINHWENMYNNLEVKIEQSTDKEEVYMLTRERAVIKKHYLFVKSLAEGNISTEGS